MKYTLTLLIILFISTLTVAQESENIEVLRLSEPVEVTDQYEVFGSKILSKDTAKPLADIIAKSADHQDKEVMVTANVTEVCSKKGCFFVANSGDKTARVTFVDYSFFVPTDSQGKDVTIVGVFNETTLTEEKAKHYAEDAGQNPDDIVGEQKEYSIVATSVVIPKK